VRKVSRIESLRLCRMPTVAALRACCMGELLGFFWSDAEGFSAVVRVDALGNHLWNS